MKKYIVLIGVAILLIFIISNKEDVEKTNYGEDKKLVIPENEESTNEEILLAETTLINGDEAHLIFNGEVLLKVDDKEIVVSKTVTEEMLLRTKVYPKVTFTIQQVNNTNLITVVEYDPSMKYIGVIARIYEVNESSLLEYWTLERIKLDILNVNEEMIELGTSLRDDTIKIKFTEVESIEARDKLESKRLTLEENGQLMDETYWDSVKNNLISAITGCSYLDVDHDGKDEMIISIYCYTVGGSTPIRLREKGVLIYDIGEEIKLSDIIFERDNQNNDLVPYFIGEV